MVHSAMIIVPSFLSSFEPYLQSTEEKNRESNIKVELYAPLSNVMKIEDVTLMAFQLLCTAADMIGSISTLLAPLQSTSNS